MKFNVLLKPSLRDFNIRWFLLNDAHIDFEATKTALQTAWELHSSAPFEERSAGGVNEKMIRTYMTDTQRNDSSPSLVIGDKAVLDEFNYSATKVSHANLLTLTPDDLPINGEVRRFDHAMGRGIGTILYIAQDDHGSGDGSSYLNRRKWRDITGVSINNPIGNQNPVIDTRNTDTFIFCGRISRFNNEGPAGGLIVGASLTIFDGTSDLRKIYLSHSVDTAEFMGSCKLGGGAFGEATEWTNTGNGSWVIDIGTTVTLLTNSPMCYLDDGEDNIVRLATLVDSIANCDSTVDSYFPEKDYSDTRDRIHVHNKLSTNPKNNTYVTVNSGGAGFSTGQEWDGALTIKSPVEYFDFIGITFYGGAFNNRYSLYNLYNISFLLKGTGKTINASGGINNEALGFFSTEPQESIGRIIDGCTFNFCGDGHYDSNPGNDNTPQNTTIRNCFFKNIGAEIAGLEFGNSDSHSIATMGHKGHVTWNNRFRNCGYYTMVHYLGDNNFTDPAIINSDGSITNGDFLVDISGWTDLSTGNGSIEHISANNTMLLNANGGIAVAEQAITIGAGFTNNTQHLIFHSRISSLTLSIGNTSGGVEIAENVNVSRKHIGLSGYNFTPGNGDTTYYVRFSTTGQREISNVEISSSLANRPLYTRGYNPLYVRDLAGNKNFPSPGKFLTIAYNDIANPLTNYNGNGPISALGTQGQIIALHGDNQVYGMNGQHDFIQVHHNNIDCKSGTGQTQVALRTKWIPSDGDAEHIQFYQNSVKNVRVGFRELSNAIDENGNDREPSFKFFDNDIHATETFNLISTVVHPDGHEHYLDWNTYRNNDTETFQKGGSPIEGFSTWQSSAPTGDTYDPNSTAKKLPKTRKKKKKLFNKVGKLF